MFQLTMQFVKNRVTEIATRELHYEISASVAASTIFRSSDFVVAIYRLHFVVLFQLWFDSLCVFMNFAFL